MGKKPNRKAVKNKRRLRSAPPFRIDVLCLQPHELLRYLLHPLTPTHMPERLLRCRICGDHCVSFNVDRADPCFTCAVGTLEPLGAEWWARASDRMRAACKRDKTLIPALRAEWR